VSSAAVQLLATGELRASLTPYSAPRHHHDSSRGIQEPGGAPLQPDPEHCRAPPLAIDAGLPTRPHRPIQALGKSHHDPHYFCASCLGP
jgi:hypothetical protein